MNVCPIREQDGQASGGNDFGSDDWIFTIREKDPKKLQNGEGQSGSDQVSLEPVGGERPTLPGGVVDVASLPTDERHSKEALFTEPGHGHLARLS